MKEFLKAVQEMDFSDFERRKLGKFYGAEAGKNVLTDAFDSYLYELENLFSFLGLGKLEIIEERNFSRIIFEVKGNAAGCKFIEGFLEGFLEDFTNSFWSVMEISCFRKCRFLAINF